MALALLLSAQTSILNGRAVWCSAACFTYNASMQPFVIALASDSAEDSDTVAVSQTSVERRSTDRLPTLLPTCSTLSFGLQLSLRPQSHDDVVLLLHPWEIEYTSLTSFEVTRDSLQFRLESCGRGRSVALSFTDRFQHLIGTLDDPSEPTFQPSLPRNDS